MNMLVALAAFSVAPNTPLLGRTALNRAGASPLALLGPESAQLALNAHSHLLAAADAVTAAAEPAARLTAEGMRAADGTIGWWGQYIKAVEDGIFTLHDFYSEKGVPYPYGCSIFTFVLGVKLITLPLNINQLSSSSQMKEITPQQKRVRTWYADNKQLLNVEVGSLFERLKVNPLAGCLPALAQIPVFLGVYYSVTSIAQAKIFTEGFLWIPNLSGPIADRTEGLTWLTEGWVNGAPKFGWEDTLAYLTIPIILVISQTVSLYLLGSFDALEENPESKTAAAALKILPFMIGWFALNAPSGLGLYWVFNNVMTTAATVGVKAVLEGQNPELDPDVEPMLATIGARRDIVPWNGEAAPDWVAGKGSAPDAPEEGEAAEQPKVEVMAEI